MSNHDPYSDFVFYLDRGLATVLTGRIQPLFRRRTRDAQIDTSSILFLGVICGASATFELAILQCVSDVSSPNRKLFGFYATRQLVPSPVCALRRLRISFQLLGRARAHDEDINESSCALQPVRAGRHVGNADQGPK